MKKRYQKAPRISKWDNTMSLTVNVIKIAEKIKGDPLPDDLKDNMKKIAEQVISENQKKQLLRGFHNEFLLQL